jgi:hypothetical protein
MAINDMTCYLNLLFRHLIQYPFRAGMALFVLAVASTLMLGLSGSAAALRFRVGDYLTQLFPDEQLRLEARMGELGPVAMEAVVINDLLVTRLKERPDVKQVWTVESVQFPLSIEANLFGKSFVSEAVVHGLDSSLVRSELETADLDWGEPVGEKPVYPMLVSRYFLDMYNLGIAKSSGLPMLSSKFSIGRHATLHLGRSYTGIGGERSNARSVRCRIVGISNQPWMLGLAMPADVVRAFNREYAPALETRYVQLIVQLVKGGDRDVFLEDIKKMGLRLSGGELIGSALIRAVRLTSSILFILALSVFLLGLLLFYFLYTMVFHARRPDLVKLVVLGVTPCQALWLALGEVAVIAGVAVGIAGTVNYMAVNTFSSWAGEFNRNLELLPGELFQPAHAWLVVASVIILLGTLLPVIPVLLRSLRVDPLSVIRDG